MQRSVQGWYAVSIVLAGAFMALLDTTIVNVALPTIRSGLHAPASTLEWIVSGYALAYGLALVPAGRAGDRFGQKPMFVGGLTVFTLASVACGISQTPAEIVTARVIQGLGAGMFYPAIGATIQLAFTGPARSKAFTQARTRWPSHSATARSWRCGSTSASWRSACCSRWRHGRCSPPRRPYRMTACDRRDEPVGYAPTV